MQKDKMHKRFEEKKTFQKRKQDAGLLFIMVLDFFTVIFKSHHHILPKLKTNSVMFYEWFDPAADISIAFWQP